MVSHNPLPKVSVLAPADLRPPRKGEVTPSSPVATTIRTEERISRLTIVEVARSWIGTPYRHQAALKGVGCDCLGLLIGVWRELGGEAGAVPPYTPDWAEAMGRETFAEGLREHLIEIDPRAAREGDLVLFRWRSHLPAKHGAILTAPDRIVHAQERAAVTEVALSDWWRRRMAYAFEFTHRPSPPCGERVWVRGVERRVERRYPAPNPSPQGGGE
jgi:NlpC/P60 family putative phage cell wall peptidase